MTGIMTLILTAQDPVLINAFRLARPDMTTLAIGSRIPEARLDGPLWCFVDWLLPDISGLEMCRRLREAPLTQHSHITMVLEEGDAEARRRALRAGADDYLIGPLSPDRLTERLAQYQDAEQRPPSRARLVHGDLVIDLAAHQARYRGAAVILRPNEFRLLAHFIENPDQVFSRTGLIDQIGKDAGVIDKRTVDVWVGRLRRALSLHRVPDPLRTVRSLGYVLDSLAD